MGLNVCACVALLLHVRLTKGNNWSKKKHLRTEMKCGNEGQNAQFIGRFTASKYLSCSNTVAFVATEQHYSCFIASGSLQYRPFSSFLAV